ncbi:hypothetical protein DPMN_131995 [Dreissena polymorpha]|uniref:Uncharacterized protein n=1 Tax=Dreissena polymorpha TaxID=45954 RepID=A0A9D4FSH5_DREPO|nr:hypothetical protein DPMN_131995 [Dreissena polymorpha]
MDLCEKKVRQPGFKGKLPENAQGEGKQYDRRQQYKKAYSTLETATKTRNLLTESAACTIQLPASTRLQSPTEQSQTKKAEEAVRSLKAGKSSGLDNVPTELIEHE